jgi:glycerophosphoryl diester phosphodiesterase
MMLSKSSAGFFVLLFLSFSAKSQHQNALPQSKNKVIVIAHRGNHVNVPENTIAACKEAITSGADYVEVDLRTTKDGHLVVIHDATVDRTTNGTGKVSAMTLAEIKRLQVFNQNKKTHRIPEFREILALCKNKINIYLDSKEADAAEAWKQIEAAGMEKQVAVYVNDANQHKHWKNIAPHIPLISSLPKEVSNVEGLNGFLKKTDLKVLDNVADPEMIKAATAQGISVWLDVQRPDEGPASWKEAASKGVQGLQTDKPAELVKYLKENGYN